MIPPRWRRIAQERTRILFRLAEQEFERHPERSKRYVELARRIAEKYKTRLPKRLKRSYCHSCGAYLKPGKSLTVRLKPKEKVVSYLCRECGHEKRYPYAKRRSKAPE